MATTPEEEDFKLEDLAKTAKGLLNPLAQVGDAIYNMYNQADKLNKSFVGCLF